MQLRPYQTLHQSRTVAYWYVLSDSVPFQVLHSPTFLPHHNGTAKGGVAIAIRDQLGLPIKFVGTGESIGDLTPFSAAEFAQALLLNEDEE